MTTITSDQLKEMLAEVVREALVHGEDVALPGLGTFRVEHRASEKVKDADGQIIMRPPRDEVAFYPEAP